MIKLAKLTGFRKGVRPVRPESFPAFVDKELEAIGHTTRQLVEAIQSVEYGAAQQGSTFYETATTGERLHLCAGTMTANLPTAVGNRAKLLFKLTAAGTLTIEGFGSETIDGAASLVITTVNQAVTLYSDNVNWFAA